MVVEEGKKSTLNAMRMMMEKSRLPKTISRTIKKKKQGAKSWTKKGKFMGTLLTDSSQQGIRRFLTSPRNLSNGMDIGHGEFKSLGNYKNHNPTVCKKV